MLSGALAAPASAHGPVAPVATSYLARVGRLPAGLQAKVVDGYVRLWLRVARSHSVVVLDYHGAPYVRFMPSGVQVNRNSTMYYLNQTPYPAQPPPGLSASTPPDWQTVSSDHSYEWHDGRLQDLSSEALLPGQRYVGPWRIPILLDGHPAAITGGLWYTPGPSLVWLWPIVVTLLCVIAAWRVRDPRLDVAVATALAAVALPALAVTGVGEELHGRPTIPVMHLVLLVAILAFVAWSGLRLARRRLGWLGFLVISMATLWSGTSLVPTLFNGSVLIDLPAPLARAACVACIASGAGILFFLYRLADRGRADVPEPEPLASEAA